MSRIFARALLAATRLVTGAHARWDVDPRAVATGGTIYFAHHASHLDTLVILAALPEAVRAYVHPVAARDYWGATRLRRFVALRCLNAVLIDRCPAEGVDALAPVSDVLAAGGSVLLFPEGTRCGGKVGAFRSGLFRLACRFPQAALVPVVLDNLHRVMPKGSRLLVPLLCGVRFGAPLVRIGGESKECFAARAQAAVTAPAGRVFAAEAVLREAVP
jgi:1-acyl-sn-glycerol-3-phosphate acyltransferase